MSDAELIRYGLQWNGPDDFVCVPMADGYWTPWHHAKALLEERGAQLERVKVNQHKQAESTKYWLDRALAAERLAADRAAEIERLSVDARRYRWLRQFQRIEITYGEIVDTHFDPQDDSGQRNDAAIDAATAGGEGTT